MSTPSTCRDSLSVSLLGGWCIAVLAGRQKGAGAKLGGWCTAVHVSEQGWLPACRGVLSEVCGAAGGPIGRQCVDACPHRQPGGGRLLVVSRHHLL